MGAVVTRTHEPMLVMEFMEYGSLHDILRNETMYLNGEIILQIARDVSQLAALASSPLGPRLGLLTNLLIFSCSLLKV